MQIELNKKYSNKFIAENLFKVKAGTFANHKQKYLQHLSLYYEYQITDTKKIILKRQLQPFETLMDVREKTKDKQTQVYRDLTHKIIDVKPLNSGSNIAREIYDSPLKPYKYHQEKTIANYIRPVLKEDFKVISKKWCRIDYGDHDYVALTQEQLNFLESVFFDVEIDGQLLEVAADRECGNIGDDEYKERVGELVGTKYNKAMKSFQRKFGFRPYKVSNWKEKTLKEKEEDRKKKMKAG